MMDENSIIHFSGDQMEEYTKKVKGYCSSFPLLDKITQKLFSRISIECIAKITRGRQQCKIIEGWVEYGDPAYHQHTKNIFNEYCSDQDSNIVLITLRNILVVIFLSVLFAYIFKKIFKSNVAPVAENESELTDLNFDEDLPRYEEANKLP